MAAFRKIRSWAKLCSEIFPKVPVGSAGTVALAFHILFPYPARCSEQSQAWVDRAAAESKTNRPAAILLLTRALEADSHDFRALIMRGALRDQTRDFNNSAADYSRALTLKPRESRL